MTVAVKAEAKTDLLRPVRRRRRSATGVGATYRVILMAYDRRTGRFLGKDPCDVARCPRNRCRRDSVRRGSRSPVAVPSEVTAGGRATERVLLARVRVCPPRPPTEVRT
ncbi:hypothetical protein GCM10009646_44910 [Streptomyces aureus]